MENEQVPGDNYCFACGKENPIGLHLNFKIEDDKFVAEKELSRKYQSFTGIVHGGIVTTLLDEAMGGYLVALGKKGVTARISVRYRKPTPVGEPLKIIGWQDSSRGRFIDMKAKIVLPDGSVSAEGEARMALVEEND